MQSLVTSSAELFLKWYFRSPLFPLVKIYVVSKYCGWLSVDDLMLSWAELSIENKKQETYGAWVVCHYLGVRCWNEQ